MKITIVTISYNSASTIGKTIQSVRKQKEQYSEIEYVIVDGASTDGTLDIIKENEDVVDIWISERDKGISDAFNKGINIATGKYICLLNSDDELLPNAVISIVNSAKEDPDVIHGNILARDEKGFCKVKKPNCDYSLLMTKGMYLNHPGMFIKKSAYERWGGYKEEFRCAMDRELLARFVAGGAVFKYVDYELALFQSGGESTKNFTKHAMPESRKISLSYGVPIRTVEIETLKKTVLYFGSITKKRLLWTIKGRQKE